VIPGGNKGTLTLDAPGSVPTNRQVSAADCEQVVSALALMTALAIDPNASTAAVPDARPTTPESPPGAVPPPAPSSEPARPVSLSTSRWRVEAGVTLEAMGGAAPEPLVFVRPLVEIGARIATRPGPAFRLSGGLGRRVVREADGGAEFTLLGARLEGCPLRVPMARTLLVSSCLAIDAGRLEVVGVGVTPAERVVRPWIAPGVTGRLQWAIVDVLVAEISGALLFPLVQDRFFVNADTTLHRTPAVTGAAAVGLGVRFP
jgi:hypothetical protein